MTTPSRSEPRDAVRAVIATTSSLWWPATGSRTPHPVHPVHLARPAPGAPAWSFAL
jgi:hypothetical protein